MSSMILRWSPSLTGAWGLFVLHSTNPLARHSHYGRIMKEVYQYGVHVIETPYWNGLVFISLIRYDVIKAKPSEDRNRCRWVVHVQQSWRSRKRASIAARIARYEVELSMYSIPMLFSSPLRVIRWWMIRRIEARSAAPRGSLSNDGSNDSPRYEDSHWPFYSPELIQICRPLNAMLPSILKCIVAHRWTTGSFKQLLVHIHYPSPNCYQSSVLAYRLLCNPNLASIMRYGLILFLFDRKDIYFHYR